MGDAFSGLGKSPQSARAPVGSLGVGAKDVMLVRREVKYRPVDDKAAPQNAGLFVGVNDFVEDQTLRPLMFAVNDAVALAHLFALDLRVIPPAHCYLALSGKPTADLAPRLHALQAAGVHPVDAAKISLLKILGRLGDIATHEGDMVLVAISSHGFEQDGTAYVMPADGLYEELRESAIQVATLERTLGRLAARKRLLFLDACREAPRLGVKGGPGRGMTQTLLKAFDEAQGHAVLVSCGPEQVSYEATELGHGVFTHFVLEGLGGQAPPDDIGLIRLGALCKYVAGQVRKWVLSHRKVSIPQEPFYKGPEAARAIPLAVDPSFGSERDEFERRKAKVIEYLAHRIEPEGLFNATWYERAVEALRRATFDKDGQDLVSEARSFAAGTTGSRGFVAIIRDLEQTTAAKALGSKPVGPPGADEGRASPGPRFLQVGELGLEPIGLCLADRTLVALLCDGSLAALDLPAAGSKAQAKRLWTRDRLLDVPHKWLGPLYVVHDRVLVLKGRQVVALDAGSGETQDEQTLPGQPLSHGMAADCLWVLLRDHTVWVQGADSEEVERLRLPGPCDSCEFHAAGSAVLIHGLGGGCHGRLWLCRHDDDGRVQFRDMVPSKVLAVGVASGRTDTVLVVEKEDRGAAAILYRIKADDSFQRLAWGPEVGGKAPVILAVDEAFVLVAQNGTIYHRPYDAHAREAAVYTLDKPLQRQMPPTLCGDVLALTTRLDRGQSKVALVRLDYVAPSAMFMRDYQLPAVPVPAVADRDHFYFVDHQGKVHRIRSS
jgi:hypothetical protein